MYFIFDSVISKLLHAKQSQAFNVHIYVQFTRTNNCFSFLNVVTDPTSIFYKTENLIRFKQRVFNNMRNTFIETRIWKKKLTPLKMGQ